MSRVNAATFNTVDRSGIVAIVGPCASGKSTLAANLRAIGYDARVSGQEHSEIVTLWKRLGADVVVALHIDIGTLRARRGETWSQTLFDKQLARLRDAYEAADIHVNTAEASECRTFTLVTEALVQRET
jgi:ABC-type glutathione transport system ATPase component